MSDEMQEVKEVAAEEVRAVAQRPEGVYEAEQGLANAEANADNVGAMAPGQAAAAAENAEAAAGIEAEPVTCRVRIEREFLHEEHGVLRRIGEMLYVPVEVARRWVHEGLALIHEEKATPPPAV